MLINATNLFGSKRAKSLVLKGSGVFLFSRELSESAINGKEIEVKFNTAIDADTLVDADDNDLITVVAGTDANDPVAVAQTLSADGRTLTLKATDFFDGDYTVKVPFETIKAENGSFLQAVNQKINVNDTTAPVLSSAKSTIKSTEDGIKLITLTFSEDVETIDNVKIAGVNYTPLVDGRTATVAVDLDATKTYEVTVVNAQDAAGNVKDVQASSLSVTVDNIAPAITGVSAAGENKVKVTVSKELEGDTLDLTAKVGTFVTNIVVGAAEVNPDNKKEYIVTLDSNYLFKNGNSESVTLTVAKDALVDTLGNTNGAEIKKTVSVSKDITAPGVSKVETTKTDGKVTGFTVTYNEEVETVDPSKVTIVNSKGEILANSTVIETADVSLTDAKKVVFTLVDGLKADKYSFDLALGYVTDLSLAANKSTKYSFTVDVNDVTAPVTTSFTIAGATIDTNVVSVDFGANVKATGTGSALNPASYQLNGVTLPADTKLEFARDLDGNVVQSVVEITLPEGFVKEDDTKAIFRVTGVQTLDNKVSNSFVRELSVTDNTAPEAKSFVATDLTTLTVTYSEAIEAFAGVDTAADAAAIADEIKLFDNKGASVSFTAATVDMNGKLVLTVADATVVTKLTTVEVDALDVDIIDAAGIAQKAGVTVNK